MKFIKNNSLANPTVCWRLAIVACLVGLLFAGSAAAMTVPWADLASVDGSMSDDSMADAHAKHEMDSPSNPCDNPNCKLSADCGMSCAMGGGCVSPSVVCQSNHTIDTLSLQAERLPTVLPSAFVSRQADSLFRPPIQ